MSLQVWLPLNGDLHNQGCSNYTIGIARGSETYNNSGKIGKCFYSNGVNNAKIVNIIPDFYNYTSYSLCAWFYIEARNTNHTGSAIISSGNWNNQVLNLAVSDWSTDHYTKMRISGINWTLTYDYNFNINTWYHGVVCSDGTKTYAYVNGVLIGNTVAGFLPSNIQGNDIYIGGATYSTIMPFYGRINDVRIYDHCLSAAEVREISQGLVLHYKLDGIRQNYILNSSGVFLSNLGSADGSRAEYRAKTLGQNLPISSGTTITISFDLHMEFKTANPYLYVYNTNNRGPHQTINGINALAGRTVQVGDVIDERISVTGTITDRDSPTQTTDFIEFYSNYGSNNWFSISNIKLEIGNKATPYVPAEMSLSNIIEDNSGYNHNGSTLGNVKISSDTARYQSSIDLLTASTAINCGRGGMVTDSITVNIWLKSSGWNNPVSCTESGGWNFESSGDYFRFPIYISGVGYKYGQSTTTRAQLCNNQWHMLTGIYDRINQKVQIYVDGKLDNDYAAGTSNNIGYNGSNVIWIGAEASGSNTTPNNYGMRGLFSDFRIYCTALDADAIRQLYEVGAKVDNKQNLHTFELIETGKQEITKQGQVKGQNLLETYLPLYDKNIYTEPDGSTWIHIFHHNNPANSKFNEPTLDWTTGKYLDVDRWYDVDQAVYYTLSPYEFMVKQKTTSSAAETKYRWVQTANPLTAVWADVKPGTVTFNTSSGYTSSSHGGMYLLKSSNLHMCIANSSNGNWYGGIGAAAAYQGGIPGYPNTTVTSGYIDLYVRVYNGTKIIKNSGISSSEFIEL